MNFRDSFQYIRMALIQSRLSEWDHINRPYDEKSSDDRTQKKFSKSKLSFLSSQKIAYLYVSLLIRRIIIRLCKIISGSNL